MNEMLPKGRAAKLITDENGQSVRLPSDFRLSGDEVEISRDEATGHLIIAEKTSGGHPGWGNLFDLIAANPAPDDFLGPEERMSDIVLRDPFEGWKE